MSIKNLLTDNIKFDQKLQVNSIEFNDLNSDFESIDIVFGNTPSVTKTFSTINYSSFPNIGGETTVNLDIDISLLNITFPLAFVSFNTKGGNASLRQIIPSIADTTSSTVTVSCRNTSPSATVGAPNEIAINLMVIGI